MNLASIKILLKKLQIGLLQIAKGAPMYLIRHSMLVYNEDAEVVLLVLTRAVAGHRGTHSRIYYLPSHAFYRGSSDCNAF